MQPIIVPTINSNDTDALLTAWAKNDGDEVRRGETIAVLETTKASFDLAAEADGLLHTTAEAGRRYDFGASLGWVFVDAAERDQFFLSRTSEKAAPSATDLVITRAAQELIERHGIDEARLRALGKKAIKASDVEALIGGPAPRADEPSALRPSAQQQTIARVVTRSRATIPDSFIVKKIGVDAALDALAQFSREQKVLAGLPDLLVWLVARLPGEFPFFFGRLGDDLRFAPSSAGNIGVTFDVGHGLFIPVVKNAAAMSLKEIAKTMMGFRMRAARNSFHAEELTGGDVSVSINMDADVLIVQPIILPQQTCMLSLSAVLSEVALDAAGQPIPRRFIQLGAAFDHRVINGYHANAFLNAIKRQLEGAALG